MPEPHKCSSCGATLPPDVPSGLCAACVAAGLPPGGETITDLGATKTKSLSFPLTEKPGDHIGRYKLLEQVGEGGCGVVYVAEQTEPVHRRVALKVIKLGMDTRQVIARFEAERQALALMDHPNIAKVLDAGATDAGRPFFVMELVKGVRITDYCDRNNLSTTERLGLFVQVCQAIQHAHQKGIIHRDIKPSNILVTLHDGVPVPKVIDFGIAKATSGQRLTDKTLYTAIEQFIGTPAYMSPEQAELSGLDIDTRSDIYALGVLLYELLTGKTPFDAKRLIEAGLDEIRRIIREEEPLRPSTRLGVLTAEEQTTVAKRRHSEPPKLIHIVRGDLDWIVMKCLEKDRTRRYETANGLAADLKRHLNNEPVVARPPSATYRFQKAFRRNKLAFSAGIAVVLALGVGLTFAAIGWRQALKARAAEEAQRKSAQVSEQKAQAQALAARRIAYSSEMNLAQQALAANNLGRAQRLLDRQRPKSGQSDLRGWEWRYLWSQSRADDHEVFFAGTKRFVPLSFSADGRLLAWTGEGEMIVTDLISRRTVLKRTDTWQPVFSHHGATLAFVDSSSTNNTIALLDVTTQKESRFVTPWQSGLWVDFTPDDCRLLTVSLLPGAKTTDEFGWAVTAWDVKTQQRLWQRAITGLWRGHARPYAISPDGAALAAVLLNGRVQVLDTKDGREWFTIQTTEEYAMAVMFSPDSSTLLTGGGYTDSTIRLWDAHNGKASGSLDGHRGWVSDLLFTPDGKLLISSSADQTIRLWNWATREPVGVLRGHLNEIDGIAVASDCRTLASRCKDGSIYLWDVTKPSRHYGYKTLASHLRWQNAVFTPDNQSILGVESGGGVVLWDALTLKETRRFWSAATNHHIISLSPDASQMVQRDTDGRLHVWKVSSGLESTNFIAATNVFGAGFTRNGKFFLMARSNGANVVVEVWESNTWQQKDSIVTKWKSVHGFLITSLPNSFVILADRAFQFFDVTRPDLPPKQIENDGAAYNLEVSPDGRIAAGAYDDGSVRLWDMGTLKPLEVLKGSLLSIHATTFSPDSRRLAASSTGREAVMLWDTETRQELLTLGAEESVFFGLKFSPDGRYLLAINEGGVAHLWSAPTWEEIETDEAAQRPATAAMTR